LGEYESLQARHEKLKEKGKNTESSNVKQLKLENIRLKKEMNTNEQKMANNRAWLVGVMKEKQALGERLLDHNSATQLQEEIQKLTKQLQRRMNELLTVRAELAA